jgi:Ala-tRNA(Pro) deacylase
VRRAANSVLDRGFKRLRRGTIVNFVEEEGEKGSQASTVKVVREQRPHSSNAQQVAAEEHIPSKMMAKSVIVKVDGRFILAVLPASRRTDLSRLKVAVGAKEIHFASELEFVGLFPDCEVGAMSPFGNLYGMPVYVDKSLAEGDEIVFNAGTHQDTIRMRYADFARLAQPMVFPFALGRAAA